MCLGRDGGRLLRFVGCGFFGKIAFDTWQGQLRPHHGAARRQRRGADPGKNHEPGQRHGGMAAAEDQGACDPARTQGASPLHPCQGSATLGTRKRNLTAAPRTKEPPSVDPDSWRGFPRGTIGDSVVVSDDGGKDGSCVTDPGRRGCWRSARAGASREERASCVADACACPCS